ncbi:hypothetical protein [Halorarum halobium]|uniref:hypothetical protein n=1 Tax=Halorarum halobium TaxID=3075121 RepID=UPI0028A8E26F|nr:hypothetical protein [Halobaculum sp. XH14]
METRDDSGELKSLSNSVDQGLKEDFDRAAAGSDYSKKTLMSAFVDSCLTEDDRGRVVVDENLEDELEEWSDRYS